MGRTKFENESLDKIGGQGLSIKFMSSPENLERFAVTDFVF